MPNWVKNKVKAPGHVIAAMVNEEGVVDFNRLITFEGEFPWDGVDMQAQTLAERVTNKGLSENALLASLQAANRRDASIKDMRDEAFEQFIQMLRNFRKCGLLHDMDFARQHWGTKWNACDSTVEIDAGTASFDTAWSCPQPVFEALSKKFPDDVIEVQFADEDIGSNCGDFTLKGGTYVAADIAPAWRNQSEEEKAKWKAFAYEIKGWDPKEYEDDGE